MKSPYLQPSDEVATALENGHAVVALESTIISHGMPYPQNLETALKLEALVREKGAVPATIAVMDGKIQIGLSEDKLTGLATSREVAKVSRRDLAAVLIRGGQGATTVAATMICAELAGIRVFATGGIGGVHRGGETSLDISADVQELSRTSVAVVCAGAKSILDIGRTLEVLETLGVPVIGYGTDEFPAFYTRTSGYKVDFRFDQTSDITHLLETKWALGLEGGALIVNPVPVADEMSQDAIDSAIEHVLSEANEMGVKGSFVTPYVLERLNELTNGASLKTNIALVENNVRLATDIALPLAERNLKPKNSNSPSS